MGSRAVPGLVDTTLREGAQAPVRYLSAPQRRAVLAGLLGIGVEEVELGGVVADPDYPRASLADLLDLARSLRPDVRRAVWCRARVDDVMVASRLEPDVLSFALPVSDIHLTRKVHRDREWALAQIDPLVHLARSEGAALVSLGLEDATRADPGFLDRVVASAADAGVDRIRVADTVGVATPTDLVTLVDRVRAGFPGDIGVHVHDDLGMACGATVACLQAGATWADVSVTGLGERAGIAATEQVAAWLVTCRGAGYDLVAARELAHTLSGWVGRTVAAQAPVIGDDLFACESGLHLAGLVADPTTYEPYPPELVGVQRRWLLGAGSGRAAVDALASDGRVDRRTVARIREAALLRGRALTPDEWAEVVASSPRSTPQRRPTAALATRSY